MEAKPNKRQLPETNLNPVARAFHTRAKEKGFWDEKRETGTLLMLIVSELSEALEADRKKKLCERTPEALLNMYVTDEYFTEMFEKLVKDTFQDEIADVFIRLLDLCGKLNIDIDTHIKLKMKYNLSREYKHGKAY